MEEVDQRNENTVGSKAEVKVASGSWNIRKRLYPPFRERRKGVGVEKNEGSVQKVNKSSVSELGIQFRPSICLRRKQFPLVCTNMPPNNQRMATMSIDHGDTSRAKSICGQDNEHCLITQGMSLPSNDICQDSNIPVSDDEFDHISDRVNESESRCYITQACGESIDYVICGICEGESSSSTLTSGTKNTDNASLENLGAKEFPAFRDYEWSDVTSEQESEFDSETKRDSKLLQDPLISHRLTMPYKEMPLSRYCSGGSFNDFGEIIFLAKRPQSPIRNIPEGRFDVRAGIAEVTSRVETHHAKHGLRISKELMDDFTSATSDSNQEPLTTLLQVLLGDVKLSSSECENDLSIILTTTWAIKEFAVLSTGPKMTQFVEFTNIGVVPKSRRSLSYNLTLLTTACFYQIPDVGYPPKGSGNHSLHRALPWAYLSAAHAEGKQKSYDTVRTCIDRVIPEIELIKPRAAYVADISCPHLNEVMPSISARV